VHAHFSTFVLGLSVLNPDSKLVKESTEVGAVGFVFILGHQYVVFDLNTPFYLLQRLVECVFITVGFGIGFGILAPPNGSLENLIFFASEVYY